MEILTKTKRIDKDTVRKVTDPKIVGRLLIEQIIRDNYVSLLEHQAREAERIAEIINGREESRTHLREACQLRIRAVNLKRQPINYLGQNFYVIGEGVYSLN